MSAARFFGQIVVYFLTNCFYKTSKGVKKARRALLPPSLREVASGVPRKPDDGRSTPSVIAASGADSSLGERISWLVAVGTGFFVASLLRMT